MLYFMGFDPHTFITAPFSLRLYALPVNRLMEGAKLRTNDDETFLKDLGRFLTESEKDGLFITEIQWSCRRHEHEPVERRKAALSLFS
ncbi:hypothetical protein Baya_12830 [Bagarius yarrelli]|uniref:Uncharacterized protein n=1 Tax=Bagarius yarrelli TaxID=175774 RepID=A0A556V484_BAGYA|nr:hypothetical protein Baya_12830 [Bagarius yarrelli]